MEGIFFLGGERDAFFRISGREVRGKFAGGPQGTQRGSPDGDPHRGHRPGPLPEVAPGIAARNFRRAKPCLAHLKKFRYNDRQSPEAGPRAVNGEKSAPQTAVRQSGCANVTENRRTNDRIKMDATR